MPEALGWGQEGGNRGWDELLGIILLIRGASPGPESGVGISIKVLSQILKIDKASE